MYICIHICIHTMPADKLVADSAGRPARLQLLFFTLSDGDGMRWREIHVLYIYNITFTIVIEIIIYIC